MRKIVVVIALIASVAAQAQSKSVLLDSLFTEAHRSGKFHGNVLVAEQGKIIYQGSHGKANRATGADLNSNSVFELASVSKQFTAMGIMLLKHQGKLSLDDSLRKFFPELPYTAITVRQLVHHTSGLPDYMKLFGEHWDNSKIATNRDLVRLMALHKPPVEFAAGEKWQYSNTGYALLASIIEQASGMSYPEYLKKYIFDPLGMKSTSVYRRRYEKRNVDNYAYGYIYSNERNTFVLPDDDPKMKDMVYTLDGIMGDGTVNSTTGDLLTWDQALYTEKLLPKELMSEIFRLGTLNNGEKVAYGFGWAVTNNNILGKMTSHTGGWPGYMTLIERYVDSNKTIIILRNHEREVQVLAKARNILFGIKSEAKKIIPVDTTIYKQYAGQYELDPSFIITITAEGGKLYAQATAQSRFELFPEKTDRFFTTVVEASIQFYRDENGKVVRLVLMQNGQEVPGPKIK